MGKGFPVGLVGLGCAAVVIAGCQLPGGSAPSSGGQSGGATATPRAVATPSSAGMSGEAASKAVCAMFTKADAEAIAGKPLNDTPEPSAASDRSGVLAMGASCVYSLPTQTIMDNVVPGLPAVYVAVDSKDVDRIWGNRSVYIGPSPEAVPSLGDEAYFRAAEGSPGVLFVHKGSHYIYIEQDLIAEGPPDIKQKEIALANIILAKI